MMIKTVAMIIPSESEAEELGRPSRRSIKMKHIKMHIEEEEFEDDELTDAKSEAGGNAGWADAMQKILRTKKPKRRKTIVLSKAKRLYDVKDEKDKEKLSFEIEKEKSEIKTEELEEGEANVKKPRIKERRKEKNLGIRVKPSITDRERERTLQKIATK